MIIVKHKKRKQLARIIKSRADIGRRDSSDLRSLAYKIGEPPSDLLKSLRVGAFTETEFKVLSEELELDKDFFQEI